MYFEACTGLGGALATPAAFAARLAVEVRRRLVKLDFGAGSVFSVGHVQVLDADEQFDKVDESNELTAESGEKEQGGEDNIELDKSSVEHVESESSSFWCFFPQSANISVSMSSVISGTCKGICIGGGTHADGCSELTSFTLGKLAHEMCARMRDLSSWRFKARSSSKRLWLLSKAASNIDDGDISGVAGSSLSRSL